MRTIAHILRNARVDSGLTLEEISQKTGIPISTMSGWERGVSNPRGRNLREIAKFYKIPEESLLDADKGNAREVNDRTRLVPVVSMMRAGLINDFKSDYEDLANYLEDEVPTTEKDVNAFGLIVEGDSMLPDYKPGDRVIFAPNQEWRNGDVVCARLKDEGGGSVFFKRIRQGGRNGEEILLESLNPSYDTMKFRLSQFRFIYPAVDLVRRIRRI